MMDYGTNIILNTTINHKIKYKLEFLIRVLSKTQGTFVIAILDTSRCYIRREELNYFQLGG